MINSLRNSAQKKTLKIILWLTIFSLVGGSIISLVFFSRRGSIPALAKVNGLKISINDFRRPYIQTSRMIQEVKKQYGSFADSVLQLWGIQDSNLEQQVLGQLVEKTLFQSVADKQIKQVDQVYVESKLRDPLYSREYFYDLVPPQVFSNGSLNVVALKDYLNRQGIADDEFEEKIKEAIRLNLFEQLIKGSIYVKQDALKDQYMQVYPKKKFAIMTLEIDKYKKQVEKDKLSEDEIKLYFNDHQEAYRAAEERNGKLWLFKPEAYGVTVNEKEIQDYYNNNKNEFIARPEAVDVKRIVIKFNKDNKIEQKKKAAKLVEQVKKSPETFETVAKEQTQGKSIDASISKGSKDMALEQAAFALAKENPISNIIETKDGFAIIKLVRKTPVEYKNLNSVKDSIVNKVKDSKFRTEFNNDAQRVIKQAQDTPAIFNKFIEDKKAQASIIENLKKDGSVKSQKLFGLSKDGNKAFYTEENNGYIIELTKINPSYIPALDKIKDQVSKDIYYQKAQAELKKDLDKAMAALKKENNLEKVAQLVLGKVENTNWVSSQETVSLKELESKKIPMQKALSLTEPQSAITETADNKGYLIQMINIEPFNQEEFNKKRGVLLAESYQKEFSPVYKSLSNYLKSKAQVEINDEILRFATRGA